jgi:hypothetical protein
LILHRDAATSKIKGFYICSHLLPFTYSGFLFFPATILPQRNRPKAFLLSPNVRHQALPEAAVKYERYAVGCGPMLGACVQ